MKGPVVLSVDFIREITSFKCQFTEEVLCILIASWGRLGLAKYCTEVFGQISFLGLSPTTRLYNAVIDALVKSNSLDLAYFKFQQMPADNCVPDRFTYNILIHGVCKNGIVDEALRLLKQMEGSGYSANVFTYTILIDGFCNAKRVDEAFKVLETMTGKNVLPSEATYRSLVHGVFRCLAPDKAYAMFLKFLGKESLLSKQVYDTILFCLSKNSLSREAAELVRIMGKKGYFPDSSTFSILMACFIKDFDLKDTCNLFNAFIEQGGKPGFNTYLTLIKALFKAEMVEEGAVAAATVQIRNKQASRPPLSLTRKTDLPNFV
ncbi:Pentatricopeptide repeat-containing protein [Thalictrum thalictroides]|uniref:Pentatricopeptide repeat-containing protein n=1 Tax=Thalictrum thalictroides TaxID=46969 RepID=A0A7J6WWA9_THATH|nr:Pentatricopeptide repeat-containing protein [Thalictrum thalictroides]